MSKIWKNIIAQIQEEVKASFQELYASVDFGAYIAPQDYFVSYIFKTEEELGKAKGTGLLQKINNYHQKLLREQQYPEEGIKDCTFASQEDCDKVCSGNWYYYYK
jgi:hypothetical protein|nr:hypothetical protein [uncultured Capnocytophaga sp.]